MLAARVHSVARGSIFGYLESIRSVAYVPNNPETTHELATQSVPKLPRLDCRASEVTPGMQRGREAGFAARNTRVCTLERPMGMHQNFTRADATGNILGNTKGIRMGFTMKAAPLRVLVARQRLARGEGRDDRGACPAQYPAVQLMLRLSLGAQDRIPSHELTLGAAGGRRRDHSGAQLPGSHIHQALRPAPHGQYQRFARATCGRRPTPVP